MRLKLSFLCGCLQSLGSLLWLVVASSETEIDEKDVAECDVTANSNQISSSWS